MILTWNEWLWCNKIILVYHYTGPFWYIEGPRPIAVISQTTFSNGLSWLSENIWMSLKISLKFVLKVRINNIPALGQIMTLHRPDEKPLSEPMMVRLPTHIHVYASLDLNELRILTWNEWLWCSKITRVTREMVTLWPSWLAIHETFLTLNSVTTPIVGTHFVSHGNHMQHTSMLLSKLK